MIFNENIFLNSVDEGKRDLEALGQVKQKCKKSRLNLCIMTGLKTRGSGRGAGGAGGSGNFTLPR